MSSLSNSYIYQEDFCGFENDRRRSEEPTNFESLDLEYEGGSKIEEVQLRLDEIGPGNPNSNILNDKKFSKPKSKKQENILRQFISTKIIKKKSREQSILNPNKNKQIKRPGRPRKVDPKIINQANCTRKRGRESPKQERNSQKPPKKEYYRVKLIRGHKRIIRDILNSKVPIKTINRIKKNSEENKKAFEALKDFVMNNKDDLKDISRTSSGPLTDVESYYRKEYGVNYKEKVDAHRTFNNVFCDIYFQNLIVKDSYELYVNYLYAGHSAKELSSKFEFACCFKQKCSCLNTKWNELLEFSKKKLIECPKGMHVSYEFSQMDEPYSNEETDAIMDPFPSLSFNSFSPLNKN